MFDSQERNTKMKRFKTAAVCATAVAVAFVCGFSPAVQKANAQTTNTPWQHLTLSQLSAVWWQWAFSIPVSSSPLFDPTGAQAFRGQPYSDLLFLGGTFTVNQLQNGNVLGQVTRSITVKRGTALFFPLLNSEFDNVCGRPNLGGNCSGAHPSSFGVPQLQALVTAATDAVTSVNSTIKESQGPIQNLGTPRLQAPPFQFSLPPVDNLYQFFGINVSGTVAPAVADGYFSFVPGLATGNYVLRFGGSQVNPNGTTFTEDITYSITVTN
jgi:hypothetical protein